MERVSKSHSNNFFFMRKINRVFHILKSFTKRAQIITRYVHVFFSYFICTCIYLPSFLSHVVNKHYLRPFAEPSYPCRLLRAASLWINICKHPLERKSTFDAQGSMIYFSLSLSSLYRLCVCIVM